MPFSLHFTNGQKRIRQESKWQYLKNTDFSVNIQKKYFHDAILALNILLSIMKECIHNKTFNNFAAEITLFKNSTYQKFLEVGQARVNIETEI